MEENPKQVPDPHEGMAPEGIDFRTSPDHEQEGWPPGVPYIVGNEGCERFSYYGMRAILYVHLTSLFVLIHSVGESIAKSSATEVTHLFFAGVYAFPMIGAIIADRFLGKYKTILYLSLVYCLGHAVLAVGENSLVGMYLGLTLIAIGSGGIKPCVSANVGDQFGKKNWHRMRIIFQIFYFSINFGSFGATLLIPVIRDEIGASEAFALPGILMFIATIIFWMGRKKYVHVPPQPGGRLGMLDTLCSTSLFMMFGHLIITSHYKDQWGWGALLAISLAFLVIGLALFRYRQQIQEDDGFLSITLYALAHWFRGESRTPKTPTDSDSKLSSSKFWGAAVDKYGAKATEGPVAVFKIISIFFLVSIFWALFDQHASTWIRQAEDMDRYVGLIDKELLPSQIPALNPLMVMILIPIMSWFYGWSDRRGIEATPLRRMTIGMMMAAFSFVAVALIQAAIDEQGVGKVSILWQIIPYLIMTTAEVMVSITGLEFAYTQAPNRMKSTVMGFWLLTVTLGNVLVAFLSGFKDMPLEKFFWIFAGLMGAAGLIFGLRAYFYVPQDYTQD